MNNETKLSVSLLLAFEYLVRQEKEIKGIKIGIEEIKLSLFAGHMTLYLKDPRDSTRKPLVLIKNFQQNSRI
jgi:hypothetical protein